MLLIRFLSKMSEKDEVRATSKKETMILDWLDSKPFTTLFVAENHENFDRLVAYPVEKMAWREGLENQTMGDSEEGTG